MKLNSTRDFDYNNLENKEDKQRKNSIFNKGFEQKDK